MTSKDSSKMLYIASGPIYSVLEYVRFLQRWKVTTIFFSQKVATNGSSTCALWACETEYKKLHGDVQFTDEESQLLKLLGEIKSLLISIEISDRTNEELIKQNNALMGLDN